MLSQLVHGMDTKPVYKIRIPFYFKTHYNAVVRFYYEEGADDFIAYMIGHVKTKYELDYFEGVSIEKFTVTVISANGEWMARNLLLVDGENVDEDSWHSLTILENINTSLIWTKRHSAHLLVELLDRYLNSVIPYSSNRIAVKNHPLLSDNKWAFEIDADINIGE